MDIPLRNSNKLESFIVQVLTENPYTSVLDIQRKIKNNNRPFSLQAIYKALRLLQGRGIVVKTKDKYALSIQWVFQVLDFANSLDDNYLTNPRVNLLSLDKSKIWHFSNLLRLNEFWGQLLLSLVSQSKTKKLFGWNPHLWFHLIQTEQEEQYIKSLKLANGKLNLIVGSESYLDKWAKKFLSENVVNLFFSPLYFKNSDHIYVNVIDNYVLTVSLDKVLVERINEFYSSINREEDIKYKDLVAVFLTKIKAKVKIEYNSEKASVLRNKFLKVFR